MLWEAQYGDFINGAQIILDEYLTSGRAKWGMAPSLVLLLPHGYEGQGPDHSSARLERFLNAAADTNMRIANCTTAAQYFHLLRRQALLLKTDPLPLVVMTPKSLLRHPFTASTPAELAEGSFQPVIDDEPAAAQAGEGPPPGAVQRQGRRRSADQRAAQGQPERRRGAASSSSIRSRRTRSASVIARYPKLREVCWVQEEPENMGAWEFVRPLLESIVDGRHPLRYIGRVAQLEPVGRLVDLARRQSARHCRPGIRSEDRDARARSRACRSRFRSGIGQDHGRTNIVVPELGESVVEARVAKWLKKEGDSVVAGDPLVELETEKIDLEVSADRAGVLAEHQAPGRRGREGRRSARRPRGELRMARRRSRGAGRAKGSRGCQGPTCRRRRLPQFDRQEGHADRKERRQGITT